MQKDKKYNVVCGIFCIAYLLLYFGNIIMTILEYKKYGVPFQMSRLSIAELIVTVVLMGSLAVLLFADYRKKYMCIPYIGLVVYYFVFNVCGITKTVYIDNQIAVAKRDLSSYLLLLLNVSPIIIAITSFFIFSDAANIKKKMVILTIIFGVVCLIQLVFPSFISGSGARGMAGYLVILIKVALAIICYFTIKWQANIVRNA